MSKKIKLLILVVIVIGVGVGVYFLLIPRNTPLDTVKKLETALNELDNEKLLECFDSDGEKIQSGMNFLLGGILEEITGFNTSGLFDLAEGLGGLFAGLGLNPEYKITVLDIYPDDYKSKKVCLVMVQIDTQMPQSPLFGEYSPDSSTEMGILPMKLIKRNWLISFRALNEFSASEIERLYK
ncbi:MAG: hypothetical protein GX939_02365 [Clostridiaceae bacterium]|nr:hypothetical protein [Clostridiaceae bacterium]